MKSILTVFARMILIPLGLVVAASSADAAIQYKIYGSSMTALTISKEDMKDTMKIVKYLEESGLLHVLWKSTKWVFQCLKMGEWGIS